MKPLGLLLRLLAPLWATAVLSVLLGVAAVAAAVGLMGSAAYIIATAALHPPLVELQVAIAGVRFAGISRGALRYAERLVSHSLALRLLAELRQWFFAALEPLAPARLLDRKSADLLDRALSDVQSLEGFSTRVLAPPAVAAVVGLGAAAGIWWAEPTAAAVFVLVYLAGGTVVPLLAWWLSGSQRDLIAVQRRALASAVVDSVQGQADLQACHAGAEHRRRLAVISAELARREKQRAAHQGLVAGLASLVANGAVWAVVVAAIPAVGRGGFDGVGLAVLALVVMAAFEAVAPLPAAALELRPQLAAAGRLLDVLQAKPAVHEAENPLPPESLAGPALGVRIEDLSFTYPGATSPALSGVGFAVQPGSRVAVVGPSGAGKSTLFHLLLRFWDPQEGRVLLSGMDIRRLPVEELRRSFGLVAQQGRLFAGTVAGNLRLGKPEASDDELRQACESAGIHEQIAAMPEAYRSWVGEHGAQLSGGQLQRLVVARTLLQDPAVLLLDEPTAHLDAPGASALLDTVFALGGGRSVVHITHLLRRMERYDQILVLDQGRLVEQGSHALLMAAGGLYSRLWHTEHDWL